MPGISLVSAEAKDTDSVVDHTSHVGNNESNATDNDPSLLFALQIVPSLQFLGFCLGKEVQLRKEKKVTTR